MSSFDGSERCRFFRKILLVGGRSTIAFAFTFALSFTAASDDGLIAGKVVGVTDGDTVTIIDADSVQRRVRLAGIDAPESEQPFGYASYVHLFNLAHEQFVTATCPKVDRYRRDVCTVWVHGQDINLAQLKAGLAWHFKRYAHEQPDDEREAYAAAEDAARAARVGLWQEDAPVAPWVWRDAKRTRALNP